MPRTRLVVDFSSGEREVLPLTPAEEAEVSAREADVTQRRQDLIVRIQARTQARVNDVAGPEWKQRQMMGRAMRLLEKRINALAGSTTSGLTAAEAAERDAMANAEASAATRRQEGDSLEQQAKAATTHAELDALEATLA